MKKILLLISFFTFSILSFSQVSDDYWLRLESDANNFAQISDSFDIFISTNYPDSIPQDKLGNIKNYYRFVNFWKSRTGEVNNEISYIPYQEAIPEFTNLTQQTNKFSFVVWHIKSTPD